MKTKYWIIGAIVLVVVLIFWTKSMQNGGVEMTSATRDWVAPPIGQTTEFDHIKGATSTAKVTVIEYSDFQCPACAAYYPMVKAALASSTDVAFIYRHFPLSTIHFNAEKAAMAAEAAGQQGKFWEMHDKLFANQNTWSSSVNPNKIFIGYAKELGLDEAKFVADLGSGDLAAKIEKDYESGNQNGVTGTPSFFVNGQKIQNPASVEEFQKLLTK